VNIFKLIIMVTLLTVTFGWSQKPLTNQQWAAAVWEALLDSTAGQISAQTDTLGLLVIDGADGKKFFLEGVFTRHFSYSGKQLTLQRRGTSYIVQQVDFQARYRPLTSSWLGFSQQYERRLSLHLRGWLEKNPGKTVAFYFNTHHVHTDTLSRKDIEQFERNSYPVFRGRWQSYYFWSRFLEPGVVILSSLTVIYLFFSMRS